MSEHGRDPKLNGALADTLTDRGAERYQWEVRTRRASNGQRPQEFDTHGFPVTQRTPSFVQRVARLVIRTREGEKR